MKFEVNFETKEVIVEDYATLKELELVIKRLFPDDWDKVVIKSKENYNWYYYPQQEPYIIQPFVTTSTSDTADATISVYNVCI